MEVSKLQTLYNMPEKQVKILSTRPLEQSLIANARDANIAIDVVSFIRTETTSSDSLKQVVSNIVKLPATVVFTSMNAAEAIASELQGISPEWHIYCLGTATKHIVKQHFPLALISGKAANASSLADEIIKDNVREIIFFCGNQRKDELPEKLANENIVVREIEVYKTIPTPVKVDVDFDGILFFSPSAVESFFSVNTVPFNTVLFAIGSTTADCIHLHSSNKIVESDKPGKQHLVEKAIKYFDKSNHTNEHTKK